MVWPLKRDGLVVMVSIQTVLFMREFNVEDRKGNKSGPGEGRDHEIFSEFGFDEEWVCDPIQKGQRGCGFPLRWVG